MSIRFKPVTESNFEAALSLRVAPSQEGYIESVSECLQEAAEEPCWRPVIIYENQLPVGFAMYCRWKDKPEGRVWLDRFLIDARYQGRGLGNTCLSLLLSRLKKEYGCREIYLSVIPGNEAAFYLYKKFGFIKNGEKDIHGEDVMVCSR